MTDTNPPYNSEDLEALLKGVEHWNSYVRSKKPLDWYWRASLIKADLRSANLRGAKLVGADLEGANLAGANLAGADLNGAHLYDANLNGAHLGVADLRGADLRGADLEGANLEGANLRRAIYKPEQLEDIIGTPIPAYEDTLVIEDDTPPATEDGGFIAAPSAVLQSPGIPASYQTTLNTTPLHLSNNRIVTLQTLAINITGRHNWVPSHFPEIMGALDGVSNISDTKHLSQDETSQLIEILATNPKSNGSFSSGFSSGFDIGGPDEEVAIALASAMRDNYAIPYYGSFEVLTPENFDMITTAYSFINELGGEKFQGITFVIGKSVVILGTSWSGTKSLMSIISALGEKIVEKINEL